MLRYFQRVSCDENHCLYPCDLIKFRIQGVVMENDLRRPEIPSRLPRVEADIVASFPDAHDTLAQDQLNGTMGEQQGELYRRALVEAERMRREGADPGNALMLGVTMTYATMEAQVALASFRSEASNVIDLSERRQPQAEVVLAEPVGTVKKAGWVRRKVESLRQRRTTTAASVAVATATTVIAIQSLRGEPNGDDAA
jgi:hypothetical protein